MHRCTRGDARAGCRRAGVAALSRHAGGNLSAVERTTSEYPHSRVRLLSLLLAAPENPASRGRPDQVPASTRPGASGQTSETRSFRVQATEPQGGGGEFFRGFSTPRSSARIASNLALETQRPSGNFHCKPAYHCHPQLRVLQERPCSVHSAVPVSRAGRASALCAERRLARRRQRRRSVRCPVVRASLSPATRHCVLFFPANWRSPTLAPLLSVLDTADASRELAVNCAVRRQWPSASPRAHLPWSGAARPSSS